MQLSPVFVSICTYTMVHLKVLLTVASRISIFGMMLVMSSIQSRTAFETARFSIAAARETIARNIEERKLFIN